MIAEFLLLAAAGYLLCGFAFAIPFVLVGAGRIDPHAARGSWGFRVLIFPGTMLLWPLLARRWTKGVHEPPEENNPHRRAAQESCGRREDAHFINSEIRNPGGDCRTLPECARPRAQQAEKFEDPRKSRGSLSGRALLRPGTAALRNFCSRLSKLKMQRSLGASVEPKVEKGAVP